MSKRAIFGLSLLGLMLASLGLYRSRRRLIGRMMGLPPPHYDVAAEWNIRVPMRDGITLATDHYAPKAAGSFPTLLVRSPYGRGPDAGIFGHGFAFIAQRFAERGYHVLFQDTRGRFSSEGEFEPFRHEESDGLATLDWLAHQPWFNGAVGLWGPSYLGYVQWALAVNAPPQLGAIMPYVTGSQLTPALFPDGAVALDLLLKWVYLTELMENKSGRSALEIFRQAMPDNMANTLAPAFQHLPLAEADTIAVGRPIPYYRDWHNHPQLDDPYWQAINHSARLPQVTAPAHFISGWYDLLLRELLADYDALAQAGRSPYLTIGPWFHTHMEGAQTSLREGIIWFDAHLKGDRSQLRYKPVRICIMGANEWREMDTWPPPTQPVRYFLHDQGELSTDNPAKASPDNYRYDPADPTPSVGGPLLTVPCGPVDNRALEARADVLCYTTLPLGKDVEIIGSPRLELYVRSSLPHTDFFGRLCDVHPDGRSINICDGLLRVEPSKGQPQPDGSLRIEIELWPTAQRFLRGHHIRLQVSSGAHPRWNRNLGTGQPIATSAQMLAADQTIYHDSAHPSALVLPVTT